MKLDIFGDIRDLRNDLLYNAEIVSKKTADRAKVINCNEDAKIEFTIADVCGIFMMMKRSIDNYCIEEFDLDPDFSIPTYVNNFNF